MPGRRILSILGFVSVIVIPGILMYSQANPFLSFDLELNTSGSVYLKWSMAASIKNARYEIERSADSKKWETIERVTPQLTTQYIYLDGHPFKAVNYYRIKMIKENSECLYSSVKSIEILNTTDCHIWPQPARNILHVQVSFSYGTIEIIDASGRTSQQQLITAFRTDIAIQDLPEGVYFVRIKSENKVWLQKLIKQ